MIDLTPLDVRKKKGDFRRGLRGYDAPHVDDFLDIVADRLESLVRENLALRERVARFENEMADHREREKALTEALVTAQEMREEVRAQSAREATTARREAENDAVRIRAEAQQIRAREEDALRRLHGRQLEFLRTYRAFLERELAELAATVRGLEMNGAMGDALIAAPRIPEVATESGFAGVAAAEVAATPDAASVPKPTDDEWAVPLPPPPEPAGAGAPEPELILSDDDVLTDDDVVAADESSTDDDDAPTSVIHLAAPEDEGRGEETPEADSIATGDAAGDERVGAGEAPPSPFPPAAETSVGGLDLDLIPEPDDLAELDDPRGEDADRSLDAQPVEDAETEADAKRSAAKRRALGDDTDNLLRSLFGDEQ